MKQMIEKPPQKHSKPGLASGALALATWFYLAILIYLFFYVESFTHYLGDALLPKPSGIADFSGLGTALVLLILLFFIIPLAGHLTGLALGFIGLLQKDRKKLFAVVGLIMNGLIFLGGFFFYVIGFFVNRQ